MENQMFEKLAKRAVLEYANAHVDKTDGVRLREEDVYIVWLCKALGNNKALLSTTLADGMYYELTYNGEKKELYFDAYKKFENRCITDEEQREIWKRIYTEECESSGESANPCRAVDQKECADNSVKTEYLRAVKTIDTLEDTIPLMMSPDYKERFRAEYKQTKIRYDKLLDMLVKYEAGALEFTPTCSFTLLSEQACRMGNYLRCLEVRAQIEGIVL